MSSVCKEDQARPIRQGSTGARHARHDGRLGLYADASQRMRDELTAVLQARWEESLRERAAIVPHSPVPLLDDLLAAHREQDFLLPGDLREVDLPNSSQKDEDPIPQGG